ncbi:MAG: hypothetical protein WC971_09575 [Coriobacteriia bacterium]
MTSNGKHGRRWWVVGIAAALVALAFVIAASRARTAGSGISLFGFEMSSTSGKATTTDATTAAGAGGRDVDGGGSAAAGDSGGTTAASTYRIEIKWYDDTRRLGLRDVVIGVDADGAGTWRPGPGAKRDGGIIAGVPVGKVVKLYIYPRGRSGKRFATSIKITRAMMRGNEPAVVNVIVDDEFVEFAGDSVSDFDQQYRR